MTKLSYFLPVLMLAVLFYSCSTKPVTDWSVVSPGAALELRLHNSGGKISYEIFDMRKRVSVLNESPLGVSMLNDSANADYTFIAQDSSKVRTEKFDLSSGKKTHNEISFTETSFLFESGSKRMISIDVRCSDGGVAFRYNVRGGNGSSIIAKERTGFRLPDGNAWMQPYDSVSEWTPAYEKFFESVKTGTASPRTTGWCMPALFKTDSGHWVLISESDLRRGQVGAHLQPICTGNLYSIRYPEKAEAQNAGETYGTSPSTPWRVIIVSGSLAGIVESTFVDAMASEPEEGIDFSFVKPGRASWSWWSDHASSKDFKKLKTYVDLSAEMKWEYSLVDANWNVMTRGTMDELARYANTKGVGLLLWYNSGGKHNTVTEMPRDIMADANLRRAEMKRLHELGVKGIKVDFFQSDKAQIIEEYLDILRDAAEAKLMVNFHGCTIPRGWTRTWPNLVSMESVKGAESYSFYADYAQNAPAQNTILPFTRNVIGPMDFTPVTISNHKYAHITSTVHELALAVVFQSGITHFADSKQTYEGLPKEIRAFLSDVPTSWDETYFVDGYPGEFAIIARKNGQKWYVAGINGTGAARNLTVPLDFASNSGKEIKLHIDSDNASGIQSSTSAFAASVPVSMKAYGGFVMEIQ